MLKVAGSIFMVVSGILSLLKIHGLAKLVRVKPEKPRAVTELRTIYGGFITGLGVGALLFGSKTVHRVIGLGWLGAALTRSVGMFIDRSFGPVNVLSAAFEAASAAIFLIDDDTED